jgi:hypothetical protein
VESFIASLSGVQRESDGVFAFGDKRRRSSFVHIYTGDAETIDSVGVSIPAAFSKSSESALLLCFQIADHLGWQVFDEQLGDFLDKSTAAEVLRSQSEFGDTAGEVLSRRSKDEASFGEIFGQEFSRHSAWVLIPTLIVAAIGAGYFIVVRGVVQDRFPWLFCGFLFGLHAGRALIMTIWRRIRDGKKRTA